MVTEASNTASLDFTAGNFFTSSLDDDTFFNVTGIAAGQTVIVKLAVQNASPTASFSTNVLQPSGSEYIPTAGAVGSIDILTFTVLDNSNALLIATNKFI